MVSCDTGNMACYGGYLNRAWNYLTTYGAPTNACQPYTSAFGTVAMCYPSSCTASGQTYKKYQCASYSAINRVGVASIKAEILANGPMQTGFNVYQDFYNYRSGIYSYTSGGFMGGHAVKIIGWGNSNGINYWLIQNSWGTSWGESGYFRIKFGQVGIDSSAWACTPKLV